MPGSVADKIRDTACAWGSTFTTSDRMALRNPLRKKEIAALEYMHKGTLYNGRATHYFKVDQALGLRETLVPEFETLVAIEPGGAIQCAVERVDDNSRWILS